MPKTIKYLSLYTVSFMLLVSCTGHSSKEYVSDKDSIKTAQPIPRMHRSPQAPPTNSFKIPVIITKYKTKQFKRFINYMPTAYYPCFYIGSIEDTIPLNYPAKIGQFLKEKQPRVFPKGYYDSSLVQIIVDTSQTLLTPIIPPPIPPPHSKSKLAPAYISYPVFIVNYSNDSIEIGNGYQELNTDEVYSSDIACLTEGIDSEGNWSLVEHIHMRMCGTGLERIMLPPNTIAITTIPIYEGTYKTKLHLTSFMDVNSNVFYGSINKLQFQTEPGEYPAKNPFRKRKPQTN